MGNTSFLHFLTYCKFMIFYFNLQTFINVYACFDDNY